MKGTVDYTHATAFVSILSAIFTWDLHGPCFHFLFKWTVAAYHILYQVVVNSDATRMWRYDHVRDSC